MRNDVDLWALLVSSICWQPNSGIRVKRTRLQHTFRCDFPILTVFVLVLILLNMCVLVRERTSAHIVPIQLRSDKISHRDTRIILIDLTRHPQHRYIFVCWHSFSGFQFLWRIFIYICEICNIICSEKLQHLHP